jgi:glycosyltransferase involved in cell wall biosynthesis
MRVLVFEPDHEGHKFPYLRHLLPSLARLDVDLTVAISGEGLASSEFRDQLGALRDTVRFEPVLVRPRGSPLAIARRHLDQIRDVATRFRPDHLLVPSADGLTQALGAMRAIGRSFLPSGMHSEAAMHAGIFAHAARSVPDRIKREIVYQSIRAAPWNDLLYVDPLAYEAVQRRGGALATRTRVLPDPCDEYDPCDRDVARRELGIPEEGRYIGCAGALDARKGTDLLVRAFARADVTKDDRLLLAGRLHPDIRAEIEHDHAGLLRDGRLVLLDRYLDERELRLALAAMDVVCTPYPDDRGLSSVALQGVRLGRMILGSDRGWVGFAVQHCGLGATCTVTDVDAFAAAIRRCLDESSDFRRSHAAERLLEFHSPSNYAATWTQRLRERLDLAPTGPIRTWEWVLDGTTTANGTR